MTKIMHAVRERGPQKGQGAGGGGRQGWANRREKSRGQLVRGPFRVLHVVRGSESFSLEIAPRPPRITIPPSSFELLPLCPSSLLYSLARGKGCVWHIHTAYHGSIAIRVMYGWHVRQHHQRPRSMRRFTTLLYCRYKCSTQRTTSVVRS